MFMINLMFATITKQFFRCPWVSTRNKLENLRVKDDIIISVTQSPSGALAVY
eukprot:m.262270 g.262270  ORF g.262270 m.262270 type:complete len:52 (+) comp45015_c0_seq1:2-157(+)